jgi:cytochrome c oxidase assembly protein subunit 15
MGTRIDHGGGTMVPVGVRHRPLWWVAVAALVTNAGIVVSGAVVRLTASGLGCPMWPRCTSSSYVVTAPQGLHGAVEFGNRMLAFLVTAVAIAALVLALRERPRRRVLVWLPVALFGGVVGNAVLGGITVLTHLNPWVVALHFLFSAALIYIAFVFVVRVGETGDGPREWLAPPVARAIVRAVVAVAAVTIALGTVVTGSGPHAGDPHAPRTGFDPAMVAQIHADFVFLLVGLTIAAAVALRPLGAPVRAQRAMVVVLAVEVAQGAIGFTQYFTGLPVVLVGVHVLGAVVLWIAALRPLFALRTRASI